ncbi:MAG: helix-turn-helix transcriptional regulator [Oscillospiraceae bacterium]|nr:helix-turn-helix transcriptional regulator [Oscillospiraceae bacterium]
MSNFSLGNRLRQLRNNRALSQEQVAHIADITPAYLGQVERGTKNITVYTLEKVCRALNISLAEFFSVANIEPNRETDEIAVQIFHQLNGRSISEKQAVLRLIKLVFSIQEMT